MKPARVTTRRVLPIWPLCLLLAWTGVCRADPDGSGRAADTAAAQSGNADTPGSAIPRPRTPRPQIRKVPGHGIDETVHRLTRGLDLDPAQQSKLREILWDEQRQVRKLRDSPGAGIDWPSATATIIDQTKTRIRAILNDEQKTKYSVDVPHEQTAPAQADLQHWMQLQDSKRQQGDGASK